MPSNRLSQFTAPKHSSETCDRVWTLFPEFKIPMQRVSHDLNKNKKDSEIKW